MPRKRKSSRGQEAGGLASMTLGERLVLAAQLAAEVHLQLDCDQRRRNRQQAKRVTTETLGGIGGAGPVCVRVTEDPALAPLTPWFAGPDQAESLRRMMRRRDVARDEGRDVGGQAA